MKRYIVIGASAAGISGAKTLREIDTFIPNKLESNTEHIINIIEDFIQNV